MNTILSHCVHYPGLLKKPSGNRNVILRFVRKGVLMVTIIKFVNISVSSLLITGAVGAAVNAQTLGESFGLLVISGLLVAGLYAAIDMAQKIA